MKPLAEILYRIDLANERYSVCKLGDTHTQSEILRDLSTALYDLTPHRVQANENWMSFYFNSKGKSNAEKEREADNRVPELYKIRHFVTSATKVLDSLRTSISANKNG